MKLSRKIVAALAAVCITLTGFSAAPQVKEEYVNAANDGVNMDWGTIRIGGGGFVSGIVTGGKNMYARTDVGGAYRYDFKTKTWVQLMEDINDTDRGFLSIDAMTIDPNNDSIVYLLAGCAYFSDERTAVFKSTDGGETFTEYDVTKLIKVHGNGYGRQCGESIAVDPQNSDIIYCGGDTDGLIMSKDAGKTWAYVDSFNDLGLFTNEIKWPLWKDIIEKTTVGTDYVSCNGIGSIAIEGGKVFVGVSDNTIGANVYVADVGKDNWEPLSKDLPTDAFPSRINKDADGNLLISYVGGLMFNGTGGGVYKYDHKSKTVTNISPTDKNSFGACVSNSKNAKELVATTCGVWSSQLWYEKAWDDDKVSWGDQFYRSKDGGETWESITPGNAKSWGGPLQADYLQDSGYDWIRNKAIHWCGALVFDPTDSNRILLTSGNGVFACDNVWDELPVFYFHPDGIEEVVVLDMTSVPGGSEFSAIGDYDGFEHTDLTKPGRQYSPNMGSTSAITYCPQNTKVMMRVAEGQNNIANGFYSLDAGVTWTKMTCATGGKAAITQLSEGKYRFFVSDKESCNVSYSDDFGATWNKCSGIDSAYGSKSTYMLVEPNKPNIVYAYATYYNSSWSFSKTEPELSDAHYTFYVSDDYGKTFTGKDIAPYDMCDSAGRIAYLGEDNLILAAGWNGLYNVKDSGKTATKKDVFYCKTVGYGAPEKKGDLNTLFIYGKPKETDPEGIYRSQDGGNTWVCINSHKLYGGTGNGNFLIGDMDEFGTVYMSTVGCGIVYGKLSDGSSAPVVPGTTTKPIVTTTKPVVTTTKPAVTTTKPADTTTKPVVTTVPTTTVKPDSGEVIYGDINSDKKVDITDLTALSLYLLRDIKLAGNPLKAADVDASGKINLSDLALLKQYIMLDPVTLGPKK